MVFENIFPERMERKSRVINMADVGSQSINSSDEGKKGRVDEVPQTLSNQTTNETGKEVFISLLRFSLLFIITSVFFRLLQFAIL